MKLLQPEHRVRDEKRAHFVPAEVEDQSSPVAMFAAARVRMLVQCGPVEECKSVSIFGEVSGYPVYDYGYAGLVTVIDEVLEVSRGSESRGGGIISDHLIPPGAGEGIFHD